MVFRIEMLPARQGDCIWIEYGDTKAPHRILIDGGTPDTSDEIKRKIKAVPKNQLPFELLIVTHVDGDHIGGILKLLSDLRCDMTFRDIWFNAWQHLPGSGFEEFGPRQGEQLSRLLEKSGCPWNAGFNGRGVCIPSTGELPAQTLEGGMKLTLLCPGEEQLRELRPVWRRECIRAGLDPSSPTPVPESVPPGVEVYGPPNIDALSGVNSTLDESESNDSSIAVLAHYEGKRVLLAGDAFPDTLIDSIQRLRSGSARFRLDALKVPHHGSGSNMSKNLLDVIDCKRYLFSTNGAVYSHPDEEAVARVIKHGDGVHLLFNYRTKFTGMWDNARLKRDYAYTASYLQNQMISI